MWNPIEAIPPGKRLAVFLPLLALTLLLMAVLNVIGTPLTTDAAPNGIVSFELAGSASQARRIIDSWDEAARIRAGFIQGLDYVFLIAYPLTIGFACLWAAGVIGAQGWPLATVGLLLAWGQLLAGLLDAVENAALVTMLFGTVVIPWPQVAYWCATIKFTLVFAGLIYVALGAVVWITYRIRTGA